MQTGRLLLASTLALLQATSTGLAVRGARADAPHAEPAPGPEPVPSTFWRAVREPTYARAERLVRHGRALLYPALHLGLLLGAAATRERQRAIEAAASRFARAVELHPQHREARLLYAKALGSWQEQLASGALALRSAEAVHQLHALRELDPLYEAQEVAFELGVLHTRAGDFARAKAEYERALALRSDDDGASLLGNLAEVTMMEGELTRALTLYERAAREGEPSTRLLALWGSAIALDRLGERAAALERARRALREDRAPFAVLRQSGVFFAPPHELYYYEALGHSALLDGEREGSESLAHRLSRARQEVAKLPALALVPLTGALDALSDGPYAALVAPYRERLRQARARTIARPNLGTPDAAPPEKTSPDLRVLSSALRALVGFTLFLRADGDAGRFADDAREHATNLARALAASE